MRPRSLFIYFRVAPEGEASVAVAVRELQAGWQVEMPGLHCELMRRADQSGGVVTLMETYSCNGGLSTEWQERIEHDAAARLSTLIIGDRHVEVFEPCA